MSEIFETVRRGMGTFSLPRISKTRTAKKTDNSSDESHDSSQLSIKLDQSFSKDKKAGKKHRFGWLSISASSNDVHGTTQHVFNEPLTINNNNDNNNLDNVPIGIKNHGNTCYMNSVLQCLRHTDHVAKYFLLDGYKIDLGRRNKYNAKKYGTSGEVTEQLAVLFKSLWSRQYTHDISNRFRNVVGKYANQFNTGYQQDAQEFLLWLLDKVHEDLNTATKKKYKKNGSNNTDRSEEEIAAEAFANDARCNNSFIHDLFQAQHRSTLSCPSCQRQSVTFEPFMCLSIPIPQSKMRTRTLTVVYQHQIPKQVKMSILIETEANARSLREAVATQINTSLSHIVLLEVLQDNFGRVFNDSDELDNVNETQLYAMQCEPSVEDDSDQQMLILVLNKLGYGNDAKRFGGPLAIKVSRQTDYASLQSAVFKQMTHILKEDGDQQRDLDSIIRLRVVNGIPGKCYLPKDAQYPLFVDSVEEAIDHFQQEQKMKYLKISVEWDVDIREKKINVLEEKVEEHHSVTSNKSSDSATLADCFDLYTQEEKLELENKWLCPACQTSQQGVKQISLWSMPDILLIHLKRFKQSNSERKKLDTLIDFPIKNLDMSPHIVQRKPPPTSPSRSINLFNNWSPWKNLQRPPSFHVDQHIFDLYAICNHQGGLQSGHYTAFCKNPVNAQWYHFDDTTVRIVDDESQLTTSSAYILFYQRRSQISAVNNQPHWTSALPQYHFVPPKPSKSHDNLASLDNTSSNSSNSPKLKDRSFIRGGFKYASLKQVSAPFKYPRKHIFHSQIQNNILALPAAPIDTTQEDKNQK